MYKLFISKYIPNPQYEQEWEKYKEDQKKREGDYYGSRSGMIIPRPMEDMFEKDLEVMLTDVQWEKVKKAVLEQF